MTKTTNFFILDAPVASPARCGICGYSGSDRKYLDPRLDFEFYGSLIFCADCVGAMANDFGFLQPAQSAEILQRLEEAERELVMLRAAIIHLENFHDAIAGLNLGSLTSDLVSISDVESKGDEEVLSESIDSSTESESRITSGDSETDKSSEQQRSDDVLHLAAKLNAGNLEI